LHVRGGRQGVSPAATGRAAKRPLHDNGPGGGQIEGKGGRNAYEVLAAGGKLRAQSPSFRAKYIGSARKGGRSSANQPPGRGFRPDQATAFGRRRAWEIGEILTVSKQTVDEHVQTATRKLGAANRTHAVAIAIRYRLFDI
jgi:hypothetical protein